MKRIRWTLLLLALGIALPAALIVERAISSLELESVVRHQSIADRVFDEMERSLSDFLVREEARPPEDYAADSSSSTSASDEIAATAFAGADEPFIIGWFSLDPSGATRMLVVDPLDRSRIASAMHIMRPGARPAAELQEAALAAEAPAPGRTRSLDDKRIQASKRKKEKEDAAIEESAYDVLQSLNRAQLLRSERQGKIGRQAPTPDSASLGDAASELELDSDPLFAAAGARPSTAETSAPSEPRASAPAAKLSWGAMRGADPLQKSLGDAGSVAVGEPDATGVTSVDPMIGRATETGEIVLARSVWQGGGVERQGLVLDRRALVEWLETRVLDETGLSDRARIEFGDPQADDDPTRPHRYLHRFAEPFEALVARLDLAPLPGVGSERPIYALTLLLALVAAIGLYAVDRMTRVVVDYAQRRSDFVAAVSHELKTPLTSIRMYAEMLRDGLVRSDEKRSEYYTTITDESERLSRLIDNVLEFSRLEQSRRSPNLVVGGLARAVREAAEKLRAHVERAGFRLKLDLDETLPAVRYDRDAVTQLVFNLVDNALKYARNAELREVEIGLHREDGRIRLHVRDHGPGVPADQLRRVFEPFFRVGEELTRTTEGTGIGLALVKELAEAMGAAVQGCNATGGGFEVRIDFEATA
jgi:signal transduction histidine kinase